jgi:hypothetical protein
MPETKNESPGIGIIGGKLSGRQGLFFAKTSARKHRQGDGIARGGVAR